MDKSISISGMPAHLNWGQKFGIIIGSLSLLLIILVAFGQLSSSIPLLWASIIGIIAGVIIYSWQTYMNLSPGIKNDGNWVSGLVSKGVSGWILGIFITGFYIILYFYPAFLGLAEGSQNSGLIGLFDPLSYALKGQAASQWFVYGVLYTLAILTLGFKFILKYRHNRYQVFRTISVMFFQLAFAFLIPEFLMKLNLPYNDFKNMWPLNYYFFDDWSINGMLSSGNMGLFMLIWGIAMIFIISPILTYFYGKRWYCSWVCGCGGLAETAGDPFRHLSDKSLEAWQIERYMIHIVLVFSLVMTGLVIYTYRFEGSYLFSINVYWFFVALALLGGLILFLIKKKSPKINFKKSKFVIGGIFIFLVLYFGYSQNWGGQLTFSSYSLRSWYGFFIGSTFSGVVGVGFYPILGSRVWCRFGCPMAAILGLQQKFFSRFRITTNGGQCISCGNCSTYCEMGIDVRHYAQKGQNIVRASCVGCGICAAVCPRGVLKLENSSIDINARTSDFKALHISEKDVTLF